VRVCIVGASGKLGTYMVGHALDRGHEGVAVCREQSTGQIAQPGARDADVRRVRLRHSAQADRSMFAV